MFAVVHQPHLLPWLGYFNKLANAHVFVSLDDVNYRRGYFHNRTKIVGAGDSARWFTLPVNHPSPHKTIAESTYCTGDLRASAMRSLYNTYRLHPYFDDLWPDLDAVVSSVTTSSVARVNELLLTRVLEWLEINVEVVRASSLCARTERTVRLVSIVRRVGADALIFGEGGGTTCHDVRQLEENGVAVIRQEFLSRHPMYPQPGQSSFVSGLSVLDAVMCIGASATSRAIKAAWSPYQ